MSLMEGNKNIRDRLIVEKVVRSMHPQLKHYVYVSDTKVDMYYAQIPSLLLAGIAAELTIVVVSVKSGQVLGRRVSNRREE